MSTPTVEQNTKFKLTERDAKNLPTNKVEDIEWEGEEVRAESTTKLTDDTGNGQPVILRFFDFGANIETFRRHKPTAQELFNSHLKGIETMLWKDGLTFFREVEPRLLFSKDKSSYRFIIACTPSLGNALQDTPRTLQDLLTPK